MSINKSIFLLNILLALFIGSIVSSQNETVNPVYPAAVVFLVGLGGQFVASRKKGVAYAATQADLFNTTQLQIKDIVMTGIYQHYGWELQSVGTWVKGAGRDIPEILDKVRITRKDLFQIRYLTPTESSFDFFDKNQDPNVPFASNFAQASLPNNKMMIFFGMTGELATGAGAADTADILAFGAAAAGDEEVINSLLTYKINTLQELENVPWKNLFVNDDAVKNFWRFPRIIVWEPSNDQKLNIRLAKAYAAGTHKYAKFSLLGFELIR